MTDLNELSRDIHANAAAHGFWPDAQLNAALDYLVNAAHGMQDVEPRLINQAEAMLRPKCQRNFAEMLMLIVSELSEAMEAHRDGEPPFWFRHSDDCYEHNGRTVLDRREEMSECICDPKPEGTATELGDALIRILDTMNHPVVSSPDIEAILFYKMQHNSRRPPMHGKKY